MALSSVKPFGRVMRASPHQTDQHQKEVNCHLLQDLDEEERTSEEEAQCKEQQGAANTKIPSCENDDDTASSLFSDKSSDQPSYHQELPTFIAHQGFSALQLQKTDGSKSGHIASRWFKRSERQFVNADQQQLFRPLFPKECISTASTRAACSAPKAAVHTNVLRFFGKDSRYSIGDKGHHGKQRSTIHEESSCRHGPAFDLARQRAASVREDLGTEKRRNSSASFDELLRFREGMVGKQRSCNVRPSSWEEEVRQAMARNLLAKNQDDGALGLKRSLSMKDPTSCDLPPTLLVKTSGGITSNEVRLEARSRWNEAPLQRMNAIEKGLWGGMNVKSPSEERWEEAAEFEEQKEFQRRARSQSMRYDALQAAEVRCVGRPWESCSSGNLSDTDHGWAVYKKTGFVNVQQPHAEGSCAGRPGCCDSMVGRSFSMRDTRMGLVMECASCGTALHDANGRLLCFCSFCAANRGCSTKEAMETSAKKKGGILRACRKLLGLGKKQTQSHRFEAVHK